VGLSQNVKRDNLIPMLDDEQLRKRKPLWVALSELWLDTELSTEDLERIAHVMADSELTLDELRQVYVEEVAPVVSPNLLTIAGEWVGFDEAWLCSNITSNLRDRPRSTKFWSWFPLTRGPMLYATERHWRKLIELVRKYRADNRPV
jgi:hypothetical protein